MAKKGRSTVYNQICTDEKLAQVNEDNIELQDDFLEQNDYEKIIKNYQKVISTFNRFDIKKEGFKT